MGDVHSDINRAIEKKSFAIYVGAGLSIGAGLPSWATLLSELIDILEERSMLSPVKISEMRSLQKDPSKYLMLAEEIREVIPGHLDRYIKEKFDNKTIKPTLAHELLVKVKSKFVITTNYDTLIEKAYVKSYSEDFPNVKTYKDAANINYNLWNDEYFILKAHGDARNAPNEIILTEQDYRKIIYQQQGYQSILHAIFSTYAVLFIGVSLSDPELLLLLGYIHNIFHGGSPIHYALIAKDGISETEISRWRKDYNIECITYDPHDDHIEITNFLQRIIDENGTLDLK